MDLASELAELQAHAGRLTSMVRAAAEAAPAGATGVDASGAVRVDIDSQGQPIGVRVEDKWRMRLAPEALGPAVTEAYREAVNVHQAEWSAVMRAEGWDERRASFDEPAAGRPAGPAAASAPAPAPGSAFGTPRGASALAEDMLGQLTRARLQARRPAPAPEPRAAASRSGAVEVTLTPRGLGAVTIDPGWARSQSGSSVMREIAEALARARLEAADRAGADPTRTTPPSRPRRATPSSRTSCPS